jgi:predicted methyltransferase
MSTMSTKPKTASFTTVFVCMLISFSSLTTAGDSTSLESVLAAQPEEVQARYGARHPQETLEFIGIKPGMTVVEALPGGGWYSQVLLAYLGKDGHLIGADYAVDMYPKFGFFPPEQLEAKKTWVETWTTEANAWGVENAAAISAFQMGSEPEAVRGTADAVVLIRALHNLARFESDGGYLTKALKDMYDALKPGGVAGIVQHSAPADRSDEWANGSRGYLKPTFVIAQMEAAGFKYMGSKDFNSNPNDQPGDDDIVWRLPPSLATSREDPELKAKMIAIGESNRMTLKFIKP